MAVILVIDDDDGVQDVISRALRHEGHQPVAAATGEDAIDLDRRRPCDLAVIDIKLPGMDGVAALRMVRREQPHVPAIAVTGYPEYLDRPEAMEAGFDDYLEKPLRLPDLVERIGALLARQGSVGRREALSQATTPDTFEGMVGRSPPMREVFRQIVRVAHTDEPVLILGETGTGKELVARAIHRRSLRSRGPFVDINCAAVPLSLFEAELFGHERGAFTDAREARRGRFEEARGGTLFLDEVGELPLEAQAKLLRVLDQGQVRPLGGGRVVDVNVRIVAATNANLADRVSHGLFRCDLYWRLNVWSVSLPPLCDRSDDVALLIEHIFRLLRMQFRRHGARLSDAARTVLITHSWPGNIRELQSVLAQALACAESAEIGLGDLPAGIGTRPSGPVWGDLIRLQGRTLADVLGEATAQIERALILDALRIYPDSSPANPALT
jgi:DNA-binding NtrC family response regulator